MKTEETNYQPLVVLALLILGGTFYPSNGVDDRVYKTPTEILTIMTLAIISGLAAYFVWNALLNYKKSEKNRFKTNKTNSLNPNN